MPRTTTTRRSVRNGGVWAASTTAPMSYVLAVELLDHQRAVAVADQLVHQVGDGLAEQHLVLAPQEVDAHPSPRRGRRVGSASRRPGPRP